MAQQNGLVPLYPDQFDLNNATQNADFLNDLLDDSILQFNAQDYARYFWYGILVVIGLFTISNVFTWRVDHPSRVKSQSTNDISKPSDQRSPFSRSLHSILNISRALSLPQLTPTRAKSWFKIPPLGTVILILAYLVFVLALEFINNDVPGAQYWTSLAIRAGWLAVAQVPLLILLAGKNNLIGLLIGSSYERLNILHRWVARSLLLMAILHMAFLNHSFIIYDVRELEYTTDSCIPTGYATFGLLIWMNISTSLPLRNWCYEFFVIQHLFTFFGFIIAIMFHLPSTALGTRTYIYVSIGLYILDRLIRTGWSVWNDSAPTKATLTPLPGGVTKISVRDTRLWKWRPGSFVLISMSLSRFSSIESHPATILSTPTSHDGQLIFLLKAHGGFTKKIYSASVIGSGSETSKETGNNGALMQVQSQVDPVEVYEKGEPGPIYRTYIDGPFGGIQRDFSKFDTVLLIAGSTGITFLMSILLHLSERITRAGRRKEPLRRLRVVWAVKHASHIEWVADEFRDILRHFDEGAIARGTGMGIDLEIEVYVTQDPESEHSIQQGQHLRSRGGFSSSDVELATPSKSYTITNTRSIEPTVTVARPSTSTSVSSSNSTSHKLRNTTILPGRPPLSSIIANLSSQSQGEMGVAVCGPLEMTCDVRNAVAKRSITGTMKRSKGIYLHIEGFGW